MHDWPRCVITSFLWPAPHNKKLHMQPHSYMLLHKSGGLVICGGIMGNTPVIGILWRFGSNLRAEIAQAQL